MTKLVLPALRCNMGDWVYYVTSMRLSDVASRITTAATVTQSEDLDDQLQRELKPRTRQITKYLISNSERFFGSIVVAVKGGDPQWLELDIQANELFDLDKLDAGTRERLTETIGFLGLSGEEKLFALDGQHRLVGIQGALASRSATPRVRDRLPREELSVILVSHKDDEGGRIRTRRLFTTLNKEATKPTRAEIIVLDEDNAAALVTRRLRKQLGVLRGDRVAKSFKSTIAPSDKLALTTLDAIYDVCMTLLRDRVFAGTKWTTKKIQSTRPTEDVLKQMSSLCASFWAELQEHFKEVKIVSQPTAKVLPGDFRKADGGHLLFRPAGMHTFSMAVQKLVAEGASMADAIGQLSKVNFQLKSKFYDGVLWNSVNNSMIVKQKNRSVAARLMLYQLGKESDVPGLLVDYRRVRGLDTASLPAVKH